MKIIEFQGSKYIEHPLEEWKDCACSHTKRFTSDPDKGESTSVERILQRANRSADVIILVKGPLPAIENALIKQTDNAIICDQCWVSIYDSSKI